MVIQGGRGAGLQVYEFAHWGLVGNEGTFDTGIIFPDPLRSTSKCSGLRGGSLGGYASGGRFTSA